MHDTAQAWHECRWDESVDRDGIAAAQTVRAAAVVRAAQVTRVVGSRRASQVRMAVKVPEGDDDSSDANQ